MFARTSIAAHLILLICPIIAAIFFGIFGYNYLASLRLANHDIRMSADRLADATVNKIESTLTAAQKVCRSLATFAESDGYDTNDVHRFLKATISDNPDVYGGGVGFEPNSIEKDLEYFCPYYFHQSNQVAYSDLGTPSFNYPAWEWYSLPKTSGVPAWSEPYFDEGAGNVLMTTYSIPFFRRRGDTAQFSGVATADLSLASMQERLRQIRIYESGYAFLVSREGRFIAHPDKALFTKDSAQILGGMARRMTAGETGFESFMCPLLKQDCILSFKPVAINGWSLGLVFPKREYLADLHRMGQNVLLIAVGGFAGLLALLMLVASGISRPIEGLTTAAEAVAQGCIRDAEKIAIAHKKMLRAPAGAKTRNEVVRLHQAIAGMIGSLDSLLSQVVNSSENVSKSAQRLDESGRQLEATVTEQAASTHQVSATSKEISATAGDLANAMRQVSVVADDAAGLAGEGMRSLSEVRGAMQSLLDATTEISGKLALISEKTANITQVITAITKVANQTNLLSLNAAIEAEKAGQYGLGFSVVAQEIRRLAEQTAVSTLEIEAMIEEMRSTVDAGVSAVGRYTDQAGASSAKVVQIIERLGRLIEQTGQLGARFGDVNEGMQAQSQSASQISEAMTQLNETARLTKKALADFKKIAEQLNDTVAGMQGEISRFAAR